MIKDVTRDWDDPQWKESGDTPWRARLRRHQGWWRQEVLRLPPGPKTGGDRAVVSMLPADVTLRPNLISDEAAAAAASALEALNGRPGLIQKDRLLRNLLSSQPLAFNLFGHFAAEPQALLPWVASITPNVESVLRVALEWAPKAGTIGGSAMDAKIDYSTKQGGRGFLAIEVKYAEDLRSAHRSPAPDKYVEPTNADPRWIDGTSTALDARGLRQFWYNQLLTHVAADQDKSEEFFGIVVAMPGDQSARKITQQVSEQLVDQSLLRFVGIVEVLDTIQGHARWKGDFIRRYVDFPLSDSGQSTVTQAAVAHAAEQARGILQRVGGEGGVLEQLASSERVTNGDPRILQILDDLAFTARFARSEIGELSR